MKMTAIGGTTILFSTLLAGCGGGGGSSSADATAAVTVASSPQGAYEGTISGGASHNTLILENDQYYTIYGTSTSSGLFVSGLVQGSGQSNNESFSSTNLKDFFANGTVKSGSLSAAFTAGASFNGAVTEGATTFTFTGTPLKSASYNYNAAANLADITGSWGLTEMSGAPVALVIATNGSFTTSSGGCSSSGTIKPRASGKNVFDVALTFGTAPCKLPGQAATGIAVTYILANGKRELLLAGVDTPRNNGTVVFGSR